MDPEVVIIADDGTEHVFPAGFDQMKAAEIVRGGAAPQQGGGMPGAATMAAGAALGAAKMAPGIVSGVNRAAGAVGSAAKSQVGKLSPGVLALDAAGDVMRGDMKGAATSAAGSAALTQVPRAAAAVSRMTQPAVRLLPNGVKQTMKAGAGPLAKGAGLLSKLAGALGIPLTALSSVVDMQNYALEAAKDPEMPENERAAILGMLGPMIGGSAR